jgi:hypothetical protein
MSRADDSAGASSHGRPLPGPVDLDRLADYAAGVLDATAAAEVERHVGTDEGWARALDALVIADEAIRAELHDLAASQPARMPADVAGRIDDALRQIDREPPVVSIAAARARRERAHRRFVTGIMAAAATLVLVLCGVTLVRGDLSQRDSGTAAGAPQAENDAPPVAAPGLTNDSGGAGDASILMRSSGADYTRQALQRLTEQSGPRAVLTDSAGQKVGPDAVHEFSVPQMVAQSVPSPLTRLTDKTALAACLSAIRVKYPGVPTLIDYARYEGRPALIVSVRTDRSTTVVAVGGGCGLIGPDEIAAVTTP